MLAGEDLSSPASFSNLGASTASASFFYHPFFLNFRVVFFFLFFFIPEYSRSWPFDSFRRTNDAKGNP